MKKRSNQYRHADAPVALLLLTAILLGAQSSPAQTRVPIPVSPGDTAELQTITNPCPTLSWAPVAGAWAHEIVAYELSEELARVSLGDRGDAVAADLELSEEPALRLRVPGQASSWTPPVGRCFDTDRFYVWFVRALTGGDEETGDWSEGSFFHIGSRFAPADEAENDTSLSAATVSGRQTAGSGANQDSKAAGGNPGAPAGGPGAPAGGPSLSAIEEIQCITCQFRQRYELNQNEAEQWCVDIDFTLNGSVGGSLRNHGELWAGGGFEFFGSGGKSVSNVNWGRAGGLKGSVIVKPFRRWCWRVPFRSSDEIVLPGECQVIFRNPKCESRDSWKSATSSSAEVEELRQSTRDFLSGAGATAESARRTMAALDGFSLPPGLLALLSVEDFLAIVEALPEGSAVGDAVKDAFDLEAIVAANNPLTFVDRLCSLDLSNVPANLAAGIDEICGLVPDETLEPQEILSLLAAVRDAFDAGAFKDLTEAFASGGVFAELEAAGDFASLENVFDAIQTMDLLIDPNLDGLVATVDGIDGAVSRLEASVDAAFTEAEKISDDTAAVRPQLESLAETVDSISADTAAMRPTVETLAGAALEVRTALEALDTALGLLLDEVSNLAGLSELQSDVAALNNFSQQQLQPAFKSVDDYLRLTLQPGIAGLRTHAQGPLVTQVSGFLGPIVSSQDVEALESALCASLGGSDCGSTGEAGTLGAIEFEVDAITAIFNPPPCIESTAITLEEYLSALPGIGQPLLKSLQSEGCFHNLDCCAGRGIVNLPSGGLGSGDELNFRGCTGGTGTLAGNLLVVPTVCDEQTDECLPAPGCDAETGVCGPEVGGLCILTPPN